MGYQPREPDWLGWLVNKLESLDVEDWFDLLITLHPDVIDAYVKRLNKKRYKATEQVKEQIANIHLIAEIIENPPSRGTGITPPIPQPPPAEFIR